MHIYINKIFKGYKYNKEHNSVNYTENDEDYVVAPIIVNANDIVRVYVGLPQFNELVFNLYDRKLDTYDSAVERFEDRLSLFRRLDDLISLLNNK